MDPGRQRLSARRPVDRCHRWCSCRPLIPRGAFRFREGGTVNGHSPWHSRIDAKKGWLWMCRPFRLACENRAWPLSAMASRSQDDYMSHALSACLPRRDPRPRADFRGGRQRACRGTGRRPTRSRGDYWACCPFHGEKTPSFHCEDRKGRYHCFGCGVSGDHFRFLTELDGMSFPEAVERIAEMAGRADAGARRPRRNGASSERASLTDVMEMATAFFQERLQSAAGAKARAYLRDRGLTSATQQAFRLGYAPDSRNALKEFLAGKGVAQGADGSLRAGRPRRRHSGLLRPLPRPHHVPDPGFARAVSSPSAGGRCRPDAPAKYLNSPETELFHKGNVLYNFARARQGRCSKDGTVIAVEGYMDVIALAQAGFENVVAPLGTALTENQLELLWRMTGEPVLCFDGDQAGLKAAWRAADLALPADPARPHGALRAAARRQGPRRSGAGTAAPEAFRAGACRGAAARRSVVDARDLRRRLRHAGAQGRTGKDAARADRPHPRRERALSTTSRRCASGCRRSSAPTAAQRSGKRDRATGPAGRAARSGARRRWRRAAWPSRRAWRARRWSSAPAASCRCGKRRSSWRWSTIRR